MSGDQVRVWPTAKAPPAGVSTGTVCEELGWSMAVLLGAVQRGELPPPDVFNGELIWPIDYAYRIRRKGGSLPGTFPGLPPGVTGTDELRKWRVTGIGRERRYTRVKGAKRSHIVRPKGGAK